MVILARMIDEAIVNSLCIVKEIEPGQIARMEKL